MNVVELPMADSVILATAHAFGATVWTQDADFKGACLASSIGDTSREGWVASHAYKLAGCRDVPADYAARPRK